MVFSSQHPILILNRSDETYEIVNNWYRVFRKAGFNCGALSHEGGKEFGMNQCVTIKLVLIYISH